MFNARILLLRVPLIVSVAVLAGCATNNQIVRSGRCADGKGSEDRQAPIVCVDDSGSTLSVAPDPIVVHDRRRNSNAPVVMQWFTRSGRGELQIRIQDGCVTDLKCQGSHCTAKTRDIGAETKCKYDVLTDKHPLLDPDLILTPCC